MVLGLAAVGGGSGATSLQGGGSGVGTGDKSFGGTSGTGGVRLGSFQSQTGVPTPVVVIGVVVIAATLFLFLKRR